MTGYAIEWRHARIGCRFPQYDWRTWASWPHLEIDKAQLEEEVDALRRLWPLREWRLVSIERGYDGKDS